MQIRIHNEEKKYRKWTQNKRELNIILQTKEISFVADNDCKGREGACERAVRVLLEYMRELVQTMKVRIEAVNSACRGCGSPYRNLESCGGGDRGIV